MDCREGVEMPSENQYTNILNLLSQHMVIILTWVKQLSYKYILGNYVSGCEKMCVGWACPKDPSQRS